MGYYLIIRGPLGSGKTTITQKLVDLLSAKSIAVDRIVDQHGLDKDREQGYIAQRSFIRANDIAIPEARKILKRGKLVIFDGNFYWKSQIEDLITRLRFPHAVFTLQVPLDVCIQRDSLRPHPHGKAAAQALYKQSAAWTYGTVVDATETVEQIVQTIIAQLPTQRT